MSFFGLESIPRFFKTVKQYGGIKKCLYKMYIMDGLKPGKFMGTDEFGNKYYENRSYFIGRSRWVEFAPEYHLDYDGSQVPAYWYGWLCYKTDILPDDDCFRPKHKWILPYTENLTGTPAQFMPYSTTKPKIHAWVPPIKEQDCSVKETDAQS